MIAPEKLIQLQGGQRRRKLCLCFGSLERDIAGIAEAGYAYSYSSMPRREYTKKLAELLLTDPKLTEAARQELQMLLSENPFDERRICNCARNHLLAIIGTFPAEWDLIIAPHKQDAALSSAAVKRPFFSDVFVYAEDIRSPFNLGSIFRTAEAFGVQKLFLSPFCPDPQHPRSLRSAMGCTDHLDWERCTLNEIIALEPELPIFVLETGGVPIQNFVFPQKGLVIIGSEELGVSPHTLRKANYGRVTIPMKGIKASLNVSVALGILMQAWTSALSKTKTAM